MALLPLEAEVLEQSQADLKKSLLGSAVPMANVGNLASLLEVTEFEWPKDSGNIYSVPRVPFPVGVQLEDLFIRINEAKNHPGALALLPVYERQLVEVVDIIWNSIVPKSWFARLKRRIGFSKNPLRRASDAEVADLLGFFLARRMTSTVRFLYPTRQPTENPSQSTF
jgi:hypothetical protein